MASGLNFLKEGQTFKGERCFEILRDLDENETKNKVVVIVDSVLGAGNFGIVRRACEVTDGGGCEKYALKITPIRPPPQSDFLPVFEKASLDENFKITSPLVFRDTWIRNMKRIASTKGVFPKIYESWLCRDSQNQFVAVTLMERFHNNLEDVLTNPYVSKDEKKVFIEKAIQLVDERMLNTYSLWNFDTHVGNFMFNETKDKKTGERKIKLRFVDFDFTFPIDDGRQDEDVIIAKREEARRRMLLNFRRSLP